MATEIKIAEKKQDGRKVLGRPGPATRGGSRGTVAEGIDRKLNADARPSIPSPFKVTAPRPVVTHGRKKNASGFRLFNEVFEVGGVPVEILPYLRGASLNRKRAGRTEFFAEMASHAFFRFRLDLPGISVIAMCVV